jgi:hypothetical protein
MRKLIVISAVLIALFQTVNAQTPLRLQDNEILQAMRDEISRNMSELKIESLEKPYYIEYKLVMRHSYIINGMYGSITNNEDKEAARLTVGVRVGSYKLDNTNFFDFGLSFFGGGDQEETFQNRKVPIELDYKTLRRELWLSTDAAYKQVAETYTKKLTTLKNRVRKDTTHDFLKVKVSKNYYFEEYPEFDKSYFEDLIKTLSGVFSDYPQIDISTAGIEYLPATIYYVNSEGIEYVKTVLYTGLEVVAATQADDGMPLANYYTAFSEAPDGLPNKDSLMKATREVAETLVALRNAPVMDEPYSGPVIFDDMAAAQIFAQLFIPNMVTQRRQMTEQGIQNNERFTAFQNKIGGRVLPEFFDVYDKPSMETFGNTRLMGHYKIDDDGVVAEDVLLVEKGYLRNLLSTRVPTKRVRKSNGHNRGGAPMFSNVIITADKSKQKSDEELRKQMLKLVRDRELPYGLIVRKAVDQNIMFTTLFRLTKGLFTGSPMQRTVKLIEVYRLYPDGREELVRGCEAKGFTHQSFKDIIFAGDKPYVMNILAPAVISPFVSGGEQYVAASVISNDVLFEDGDIGTLDEDFPKPPILPSPLSEK